MSLHVNTASGTTLDLTGIVPLILDINDHTSVHNLLTSTKLKQLLIMQLDFVQRYRPGIDWDAYGI